MGSLANVPAALERVLHDGAGARRRLGRPAAKIVVSSLLAAGMFLFHEASTAAAQQGPGEIKRPTEGIAPGQVHRDCPVCPEMVRLPPGSFLMGSPPDDSDRAPDEEPQHKVTIGYPLSFGRYEVTRGQYAAFVLAAGYSVDQSWLEPEYQTDRDPVVLVSWEDAQAYVAWLTLITGNTYRLPSEAEWEYAARAGTTTVRYWDDGALLACAYANVDDEQFGCSDGFRYTAPVGLFRPNAFGLYDMLGNVWEWVADCWNENYTGAPGDGQEWLGGDCERRVLRGGARSSGPQSTGAARRDAMFAGFRYTSAGFRVVRAD